MASKLNTEQTLLEGVDKASLSLNDKGLARRLSKKITLHIKQLSTDIIDLVATFYFAILDSDTPLWAKAVIFSAIAYFISPLDVVPDFLPTGYADDIAVLLSALSSVSKHIKDSHKQSAIRFRAKLLK